MSSSAALTVVGKDFGQNGIPSTTEVSARSTLKKKYKSVTYSLSITDATLKDQGKTLKDVVVAAEGKLADGVKGAVAYDVGGKNGVASLTVDKNVNGNDLTLKATYKQKGDAFILDETWKLDKNNKLSGSYNFRTEEAIATYTFTNKGWTAAAAYNFAREAPAVSISKKEGKHTVEGVYAVKDETATLTWTMKPLKAQLKAKVNGSGFKAQTGSLMLTQEWDL